MPNDSRLAALLWILVFSALPLAHGPGFTDQHLPKLGLLTAAVVCSLCGSIRIRRAPGTFEFSQAGWVLFWLSLAAGALHSINGPVAVERLAFWGALACLACIPLSLDSLRRTLVALSLGGALAALYGLAQSICLPPSSGYPLFVSSFGNVNFASEYLAAVLPLLLILGRPKSVRLRLPWFLAAASIVFYLLRAGSRAAWVGGLAGLAVGSLLLLWPLRPLRWLSDPAQGRELPWPAILRWSVGGIAILALPLAIPPWRDQIIGRLGEAASWSGGSVRVRFLIWSAALRMFADNPWFGVGPGQFAFHYHECRPLEEYLLSCGSWVDHPHNAYLLLLTEGGVAGASIFLALFLLGLARWISVLRRDASNRDLAAAALSSLTATAVVGIFSCPLLSTATAALFALLAGRPAKAAQGNEIGGEKFLQKFFSPKLPLSKIFEGGFLLRKQIRNSLWKMLLGRSEPKIPCGRNPEGSLKEVWGRRSANLAALSAAAILCLVVPRLLIADFLYTRGRREFERREYGKAASLMAEALSWHANPVYRVECGRALLAAGDRSRAADLFAHATVESPCLEAAHVDLGLCRQIDGDAEGACEAWRQALALFPGSSSAAYNLSKSLVARGLGAEAVPFLEKLAARESEKERAFSCRLLLGRAHQAAGALDRAYDSYLRAAELDFARMRSHAPWLARGDETSLDRRDFLREGRFHEWAGDAANAFVRYVQAQNLDPRRAAPHIHIYLSLPQAQAAKVDWPALFEANGLKRKDPETPQDRMNRGILLEAQGKTGQAWVLYNRAMEIDPQDPVPCLRVGMLMKRKSLEGPSFVMLQKASSLGGPEIAGLISLHLAEAYLRQKDFASAQPFYLVAFASSEDLKAWAHVYLARMAVEAGEGKDAVLAHLRRAREKGGIVRQTLEGHPDFRNLVASEAFREFASEQDRE